MATFSGNQVTQQGPDGEPIIPYVFLLTEALEGVLRTPLISLRSNLQAINDFGLGE